MQTLEHQEGGRMNRSSNFVLILGGAIFGAAFATTVFFFL